MKYSRPSTAPKRYLAGTESERYLKKFQDFFIFYRNNHCHYWDFSLLIDNRTDQPWFVAKEVCDILGFDKAGNACRMLDDDEKQVVSLKSHFVSNSPRGNIIINESGLYNLIMKSRRPEAKAFHKWVTGEVQGNLAADGTRLLPPIRLPLLTAAHHSM